MIWFGSVAVTVLTSFLLSTEPQDKAANEDSQVKIEERERDRELSTLRDMNCSL